MKWVQVLAADELSPGDREVVEVEEREIVLRSAAAIASRPQLPTGKKSARLKRSVAGSLMELLRLEPPTKPDSRLFFKFSQSVQESFGIEGEKVIYLQPPG